MRLDFDDEGLRRLYVDREFAPKRYGPGLIRAYRKVVFLVGQAQNQFELRSYKALHLEALQGDRKGQHSLRLWKGWRLVIRFEEDVAGSYVAVVELVDYHP